MNSSWLFLLAAIVAEVAATTSLRFAVAADNGWPWWVGASFGYLGAFVLFFAALSHGAPLAASYATWSGLGVALTAVVAWSVFAEQLTWWAAVGIGLVIAGVIMIELLGAPRAVAS